jgi:large subunit ribosomal protein L5
VQEPAEGKETTMADEKPEKKKQKKKPADGAPEQAAEKQPREAAPARPAVPARLKIRFQAEVRAELMKEFGFTNPMQAPKLDKIVVNMGLGEAINNGKIIDASVEQLGAITGQKPVVTKSRKSIANFKLRQGQSIGAMVTLRGDRMYEFFDRLVSVALPRVRDFKGVSPKAFDGKGNYTLGVREQIIFPEINYDKVEKIKGLNITVVTTARNDEEGRALLRHLGMPFRVAGQ